jgi:branched-chain amino acid transport system substrate-binding protein
MVVDSNAAQVLKDKVAVLGDNTRVKFIGPDGIQTQYFIDEAGVKIAEGVYASVEGVPFDAQNDLGQQFIRDYQAAYGVLTEPYAIYGYETMNVLLKAIENVCDSGGDPTDRRAVRDAVFAIKDFKGVLGTWSFDKNGDTTLTDMTFYQVQNGEYVEVGVYR